MQASLSTPSSITGSYNITRDAQNAKCFGLALRKCSSAASEGAAGFCCGGYVSFLQGKRYGPRTHAVARADSPSNSESYDKMTESPLHVKMVGFGSRGASALQKLVSRNPSAGDDGLMTWAIWCIDNDKNAIENVSSYATGILLTTDTSANPSVAPDDHAVNVAQRNSVVEAGPDLDDKTLGKLIGRRASDSDGRGNINTGDGGVAFVLSPASGIPGGAHTLLRVVSALRKAGYFTVAAVTAPFEFEGSTKAKQAIETIHKLEDAAHLVAVMEQNVLMQAFGDSQLTVSEATDIADTALEHTVRCVLQAVQAREILKSSGGARMWHGRDLRHYKRLLAPPLQQLLSCPGHAVLGRGLASLPMEAVDSMGYSEALMHLASDAVIAASESPFLDRALETASAVLCCIGLPSQQQLGPHEGRDEKRHAIRIATQAAAGALRSITDRSCNDFVLCAEPKQAGPVRKEHVMTSSNIHRHSVQVEVTLLVLKTPTKQDQLSMGTDSTINRAHFKNDDAAMDSQTRPKSRNSHEDRSQQLPSSSWSMLSAMAGGARKAVAKDRAMVSKEDKSIDETSNTPGSASREGKTDHYDTIRPRHSEKRQQESRSSFSDRVQRDEDYHQSSRAGSSLEPMLKRNMAEDSNDGVAPNDLDANVNGGRERVTIGDYLAASLTAQSLDLPPAAARWRQQQRADRLKQRRLIVWEVDELESWQEEDDKRPGSLVKSFLLGRGTREEKKVNIKDRVAGVLMQDREDAWEAEQQQN